MKNKTGRGHWAREWTGAFGLQPRSKGLVPAIAKADSVAKALTEIQEHRAAGFVAPKKEDTTMTDIIKSMSDRLSEIRKAHPGLTEGAAMLKLAESRNPEDQALWREYKARNRPCRARVEKSVKVKKTLKTMGARIDEIMSTDRHVAAESRRSRRSRARANPIDELWRYYRIASSRCPTIPCGRPGPGREVDG